MLQTPGFVCLKPHGEAVGLGVHCFMVDVSIDELQWKRDVVDSKTI